MKFASVARVNGREALRERHRRARVAAPLFRASYPQLDSLQLNFDFSDRGDFIPSSQVTVFHPPAAAFFRFACPYSDCDGEFDLSGPVEEAVKTHETGARGQLRCAGKRHRGVECTLCLDYTISAIWP